jgi:tetratricopeptide (TPR) repeat protein/transcriptional regulator with XRE-family HTH domain
MIEPRSHKQQREQLVRSLRAEGTSWVAVADVLRQRYRLNARVAFRYAHGWSQRRAADEWNRRWPDELKTAKIFSYWEQWPSNTGHVPSFDNLCKLAELYECAVSDLLVDVADFRHLDTASRSPILTAANDISAVLPAGRTLDLGPGASMQPDRDSWDVLTPLILSRPTAPLVQRLQEVDFNELARVIVMWIQRLDLSVSRRALLCKLSAALTAAAVAPLFDVLNPDGHEQAARVVQDSSLFEESALRYCEGMITSLRQQGDVLGPHLTLPSAIGHRELIQRLAHAAPERFQQRAVSAYAELTQLVGWLCFNMGDYRSAQHYYDDARSAAHDAHNVELVTYILCTMSHLATWQDKPRVGIDHAVAAAVWADQAHSPLARAYAADVAVRAYVADNQPDKCREALDREYTALQTAQTAEPPAAWWYFYDQSFYWATEGECALKLKRPDAALEALDKSLTLIDPANLHNYSFGLLFRAEARIQQAEIPEGSTIIGDVAQLTAGSASQRIAKRISAVRSLLVPWEQTKPVRELDERLAVYRPVVASGSGSTNSTYSW